MESLYQGQQFVGHGWFLVCGARCKEEDLEHDVLPNVEISIVAHTNREDDVPARKLEIRGRKNIEAVFKACQYALSQFDSKTGPLGATAYCILGLLSEHYELTIQQLMEAYHTTEEAIIEAVAELMDRKLVVKNGPKVFYNGDGRLNR